MAYWLVLVKAIAKEKQSSQATNSKLESTKYFLEIFLKSGNLKIVKTSTALQLKIMVMPKAGVIPVLTCLIRPTMEAHITMALRPIKVAIFLGISMHHELIVKNQ